MKGIIIASIVLHVAWGASIVDLTCPDSCTCTRKDGLELETSCVSYEFIKKLTPKQQSSIVRLNINNASLFTLDLKLKYLKHLHILDLSNNKIATLPVQPPYLPKLNHLNLNKNHLKHFTFSQLPKNLQELDLSHNYITRFPADYSTLTQLKIIHFNNNPIDCDCDNLLHYQQMLKEGVTFPEEVICASPTKLQGHNVNSVNCSLTKDNFLDLMLGDEAGSGEEDEFELSPSFEGEELINAQGVTEHPEPFLEEGSGDEGSGDIPILPIPEKPKACHFNCSTPSPVGANDEEDASPLPALHEQVKIIFNDLINPEEVVTTVRPTEEIKEQPVEPNISDKLNEVETVPTNDTIVGEMERASLQNSNSTSAYIICGLLVAFAALILLYYLNKKKNQKRRKRNRSNENGYGEEMKPLGKPSDVGKLPEVDKLPEKAPLLNGQNGKLNGKDPEEFNEVELRSTPGELTVQPERVTIKAGELVDSIPKTPMLVHRQVNSDGEIVTTAVNSD